MLWSLTQSVFVVSSRLKFTKEVYTKLSLHKEHLQVKKTCHTILGAKEVLLVSRQGCKFVVHFWANGNEKGVVDILMCVRVTSPQ